MITRSQSSIIKPIKCLSLHTSSLSLITKSPFIALKDPNWCNAIYDEYNTLVKNGTWILVPRPSDVNLVRYMWLFKHKFHADGTLSRYKARLIANGSNQQHSVDFDETFSPGAKPTIIRHLYMHSPPGFVESRHQLIMYVFAEVLYGLNTSTVLSPVVCSFLISLYFSRIVGTLCFKRIQQVCLYMHDPREPHFAALKRIMRYVQGTLELGLQLYASATTSLVGYTDDADWASCPSTRRSISDYCVFLGDNLLSWSAKRQHTISRSSAEAEYRGVANVVAETAGIRNLLCELHSPLLTATLVYCDNVSAFYMSANPVQHQRTKHIEIDIHFVRDMVKAGHVRVLHVPSHFQYGDIFTKGLPSALFEDFRSSLSVRPLLAPTAGAY
ncbi:ribonuclease H-like domain-containing protein [Tanacetum coccineum]|uniref:Ribonuclease H-like domain-containing protein n=1 Tax=Tanacetum coccineum TaxID=301880 RepID=A0ABQ5JCM9_9ASTR